MKELNITNEQLEVILKLLESFKISPEEIENINLDDIHEMGNYSYYMIKYRILWYIADKYKMHDISDSELNWTFGIYENECCFEIFINDTITQIYELNELLNILKNIKDYENEFYTIN